MSGPEFFNPSEGGESYDPAAFDRFKEQMKKNAAFIAAAKKGEQKQKKKEDQLAKILLAFIQKNQKRGILLLAAQLLAENIPASFVLSIIVLGNEDIQQELKTQLRLMEGAAGEGSPGEVPELEANSSAEKTPNEMALAPHIPDGAIPLKLRIQIDDWARDMFETASAVPFRILETALNKEGALKQVVVDCAANVLDDFCAASGFKEVPSYQSCFSFCDLLMKNLMQRLKAQIENQKELT